MNHERGPVDVLDVERLAARRGYLLLFAGIGFSVGAGEALSVTGPNGSGKTTLLRIVAGLSAPAEGEVRWRNQVVRAFDSRIREAVAFNGHLPALKDELTAEENLTTFPPSRAPRAKPWREARRSREPRDAAAR